ncbi:MAG: tetratricopeptide repeat protein [Pyrinomonadaceae bacterium]
MSVRANVLIAGLLSAVIILFNANETTAQKPLSKVKNVSGAVEQTRLVKTMEKGDALWRNGEVEKAVSIYEKLATSNSKNALVLNTLGGLYVFQERYEEAAVYFLKALELEPDFATANFNLSVAYFHLKQFGKSLPPAEHAAKLKPENLKIQTHLCELRATIAKDKKAIRCFESLEKRFEPKPRTRVSFALLLMKTDNADKAITLLEETSKTFPDNPTVHNVLGMAYMKKNRIENAIRQFRWAIELDPKLSYTRFNLAFAFLLDRNKKAALEQYQLLKKLDTRLAKRFYKILYSDKVVFVEDNFAPDKT